MSEEQKPHQPTDAASVRAQARAAKKAAKKAPAKKATVVRVPKPPYKLAIGTVDDGKYVFEKTTYEDPKALMTAVTKALNAGVGHGLRELMISVHVKEA